ncbi:cell wall-associated hydrolase, invasion-associated protein [Hoeflea sp. IMCC20628]|uniref:C40 family peptidase n=1 Tax=Hoeflea sp. IMCC20628 TaxID=1620421 RepID=UPI00063A9F1D|nr:NlpC/P60 family protein [Hoeflea sp. IMCC20628]AKI02752.1 cell wall-associated hydrolase, invasion-associated protein [Hoeflea sp. IMCC20628]
MSETLDHRLHAYRADLADIRLKGRVEAERFAEGTPGEVILPVVPVRPRPDADCSMDTEALLGETLTVFDRSGGWAWVKLAADGYVGYLREEAIAEGTSPATHVVSVPRSFVYPGPDLRFPHLKVLSMGSRVNVVGAAETRATPYALLDDGSAIIATHLRPIDETAAEDAVSVAARFLHTPYLWGGRSGLGIDCSGLVQMALAMTGKPAPRDSDQQAADLGTPIDPDRDGLQRGDLVFWKGHVGFLEDQHTLLHASGATMSVTREPLREAIDRIAKLYSHPTGYRRP